MNQTYADSGEQSAASFSDSEDDVDVIYPSRFSETASTIASFDDSYRLHQYELQEQGRTIPLPDEHCQQSFQALLAEESETLISTRHNSPSADQLRQMNNQLNSKEADLAYFWQIWNTPQRDEFVAGVEFIVQRENWPMYRYQYERPLELFLSIFYHKFAKASFLGELYPGLPQLVGKIAAAVEFDSQVRLRFEERNSMALYEHYLEEIESKNKQQGAFYIRDESDPGNNSKAKIPIGDFIARSPYFDGSNAWADIFLRAGLHKRRQVEQQPFQDEALQAESLKGRENRAAWRKRLLEGEEIMSAEDHPCCTQYFYFNYRTYVKTISICPVLSGRRFAGLWETAVGEPAELQGTLLDICALLNSGGGVILFNCFKNYLDLWPKGEIIEEDKFKATKQLFADSLRSIHPEPRLDEQIFLSFVPLVRNPLTDGLAATGRSYIEGLYVLRIVVRPREEAAEQVYFYSKQPALEFRLPVVDKDVTKLLLRSEATKFMKRKFTYYYIPEKDYDGPEEFAMLRKGYSKFGFHETCLQPERGVPITARVARGVGRGEERAEQLEGRYKYLTLLVAAKANHPLILQRLRGKGIDCDIAVPYQQYKFKMANNSAALFHNLRFDLLLNEVACKKDFEFNGRYIMTILVTPFIRLVNRDISNPFPEDEFLTLDGWLRTEHPNEELILWRFQQEKDKYEFYLQTGSRLSTLFMYFVINHYSEKCSFKGPKNYERMAQHERNAKMKVFYPRPTSEQTTTNRTPQ